MGEWWVKCMCVFVCVRVCVCVCVYVCVCVCVCEREREKEIEHAIVIAGQHLYSSVSFIPSYTEISTLHVYRNAVCLYLSLHCPWITFPFTSSVLVVFTVSDRVSLQRFSSGMTETDSHHFAATKQTVTSVSPPSRLSTYPFLS